MCINTKGMLIHGNIGPTLPTLEEFLRDNPGYQPVLDKNHNGAYATDFLQLTSGI